MNDKLAFKNALSRQADVEKKLAASKGDLARLLQEYAAVEQERDELCRTFEDTLQRLREQSVAMNKALNRKIESVGGNGDAALTPREEATEFESAPSFFPNDSSLLGPETDLISSA